MRLLLWTREDPASLRLAGALVSMGHFQEQVGEGAVRLDRAFDAALARVEGSMLAADFANRAFEAAAGKRFRSALFLSKHSAASGTTALTAHPVGNPGPEARLGGAPRTLVPADPQAQSRLLLALLTQAKPLGVPATFEATHHGPRMDIPSLFVEVGSGPQEWENPVLCEAVARAVVAGYLSPDHGDRAPQAIGLGGGHYAPRISDRARREGSPIGHIIPGYALDDIDAATVASAATQSGAEIVFVDGKKDAGPKLQSALSVLEGMGLRTVHLAE